LADKFYYDSVELDTIDEKIWGGGPSDFITSDGKNFITSGGSQLVIGSGLLDADVISIPNALIDQRIGYLRAVNSATGVRISLSESKTIDFIAIYTGSVTVAPTINVSGSSDSSTGFTSFYTSSSVSSGWNIYELSSSETYQYYSIQFEGSPDFTIGELILGEKFEPSRRYDIGHKQEAKPIVDVAESYSGIEYSNKLDETKEMFSQKWEGIPNTEKVKFETMRDSVGDKKFIYYPGSAKYVKIDKDSLWFTEVANQVWDTEIKMSVI